MYYSYKSKKNTHKKYKFLLIISIIALIVYSGYRYRQYLFFWEYTYNKLLSSLSETEDITDREKKIEHLLELSRICENYNLENQTSPEAFALSGKVHFRLGELYQNATFTDLLVNGMLSDINCNSRDDFLQSIKYFKKTAALSQSRGMETEDCLMMAMACFYTDYCPVENISSLAGNPDKLNSVGNIEHIRFCAIINILNGSSENGLNILKKNDTDSDGLSGRLVMATACAIAEKYTDSILEYKKVLDMTADSRIIKLVNLNLGKIYFTQSLYRESLAHFTRALNIDTRDNRLKIWIGKNYSALGQKTKAKTIWTEVIASDHKNKEARRLLGMM